MYRRLSRHSLASKAILLGMYFVFFAVQLHLRYAFLSFYPFAPQAVSVQQASKAAGYSTSNTNYVEAKKQEAKLNKRYYPQDLFGPLPAQAAPQQTYTAVHEHLLSAASPLNNNDVTYSFLRGPPYTV